MFIILDFEYTTWPGALESNWSQEGQYREVVQMTGLRFDDDFNEIGGRDILVKPVFNPELSPLFIELTGITQEIVDGYGIPFADALKLFSMFIRPETSVICMNGDEGVMRENCALHDVEYPFGSWYRLRPFLEACGVTMAGLSSGDLHKLTVAPLTGHTHNALHDVRSMAHWLKDAKARGVFESVHQLGTGIPERDPRSVPL